MIPDGVDFNNLKWEEKEAPSIKEELEGYTILGAEVSSDWAKTNGKPAINGVLLYLQAGEELKVVSLDTFPYLWDGDEDATDPIQILVAHTGADA